MFNLSTAEKQQDNLLIPDGKIAKVRLGIKLGYHNDITRGWTDNLATKSSTTGAVYLNANFEVLYGGYKGTKVWTLIGLHSEKGPRWEEMGCSFMRALVESARNIQPDDDTPEALAKREISNSDLIGLEFLAEIKVTKNHKGEDKNEISKIITPEYPQYLEIMGKINPSIAAVVANDEIPF